MPEASQTRAYLALLAIMVLWGSYPAMAKLAFRDFPPVFLTALRAGLFRGLAASLAGMSPTTVEEWMKRGRE